MAFDQIVEHQEIASSGNDYQIVHTVPAGKNGSLVDISITNQGSTNAENIAVYIVSGTFSSGNTAPNAQYLLDPPFTVRGNSRTRVDVASVGIEAGERIVVRNGSGNNINVRLTYFQNDA